MADQNVAQCWEEKTKIGNTKSQIKVGTRWVRQTSKRKSHFFNCAAFEICNKSKRWESGLRVFKAANEEGEVGGEKVGEDEQVGRR